MTVLLGLKREGKKRGVTNTWSLTRPHSSVGKESICNAGDPILIPGSGRSAGEGIGYPTPVFLGFPGGSAGKESTCNAGDLGSIPVLGRPPGERKHYPLQYSGLENSMDYIAHGRIAEWDTTEDFHFPFFSVVLEFSGLSLSSSCPPHFPVLQFLLLPACVGIYGKHLGRAVA